MVQLSRFHTIENRSKHNRRPVLKQLQQAFGLIPNIAGRDGPLPPFPPRRLPATPFGPRRTPLPSIKRPRVSKATQTPTRNPHKIS